MKTPTNSTPVQNYRLGLPLYAILGLAALAAPRVVLHDLHIVEEGSFLNALLVFVPLMIWIAVVVAKRVSRPFVALLAVGVVYGILLATGHFIFWEQAFPNGAPQLGDNLANIDPLIETVIIRTFSSFSSLVTGTLVGAVCGVIAMGLNKLIYRSPATQRITQERARSDEPCNMKKGAHLAPPM